MASLAPPRPPGMRLAFPTKNARPMPNFAENRTVAAGPQNSLSSGPGLASREGYMWLMRSWSIGLVAAISLLAQGTSQADPVRIRISWIAPLSNWGSLLMEKKELARHMGKSYILEPVRYAGTPQQITALATNE